MSNTAKFKSKVTLSKQSKVLAASYINPHERGAFIRSQLDAENAAFMARFAKPAKDKNNNNG
jgi:hypothetical protein